MGGGGRTCITELVLVLNETNMFVILVCYLFSCNEETKHNTVTLFSELKTLL